MIAEPPAGRPTASWSPVLCVRRGRQGLAAPGPSSVRCGAAADAGGHQAMRGAMRPGLVDGLVDA